MSKLLNRKTNRKIKKKEPAETDLDMHKFKEQMIKEMSRFKNKKTVLNISIDKEYERCYKQYISEGFSYSTQMIITRMFSDSKKLPRELRNEYPLHTLITQIACQLMMNELEIVYFSLYLDTCGWINENSNIIEHFLITGLGVKKYLNINTKFIENFLAAEYPNILEKFNKWLKMQKDRNLLITVPRDVNERFNLLKRPYNSLCKNNFIDYNEAVDRILQMSMPYCEGLKNQRLTYQSRVNNEVNLKKKKKIEEKNTKIKEDININCSRSRSKKKVKKEKPSFHVVKNEDNIPQDYDQEKIKAFLNLKDDSLNSSNNIINSNVSVLHGKIDNKVNNNSSSNDANQIKHDDNRNDKEKEEINQNNYNGSIRDFSHQSSSNLMHNHTSNMNFNNFPYTNVNYSTYNLDFIKQSSDFNFNGDQIFFGRNTSGLDQGFFRRNSTQNFEPQDELNDAIFKPIECKQHISFGSLAGDYKLESNILNMTIPKPKLEDDFNKKQDPIIQNSSTNKTTNDNPLSNNNNPLVLTHNANIASNAINNSLSFNPLGNANFNNSLTNNNLIQNNSPAKKNFLFAFQDLKNNKQ